MRKYKYKRWIKKIFHINRQPDRLKYRRANSGAQRQTERLVYTQKSTQIYI